MNLNESPVGDKALNNKTVLTKQNLIKKFEELASLRRIEMENLDTSDADYYRSCKLTTGGKLAAYKELSEWVNQETRNADEVAGLRTS